MIINIYTFYLVSLLSIWSVEICRTEFVEMAEKLSMQMWSFFTFVTGTETKFQNSMVEFYFYKKDKTEIELPKSNLNNFLDTNLPTIIVVHGYTDHKDRKLIVKLRDALLANVKANVILCDWRKAASQIYFTAVSNTYPVGMILGDFLDSLQSDGFDLSNVHLIGHSLGAHISGIAGAKVNGRIGRITGLDPAGPLFEFIGTRNTSMSLDKTDAQFVDVIHSAVEIFGVSQPIGHADFYPNDGLSPQPGCNNIILSVTCSHIRSMQFFTESIEVGPGHFLSKSCLDKEYFYLVNCSRSSLVPMGYHVPSSARGLFYLQTNKAQPYSMGEKFFRRTFLLQPNAAMEKAINFKLAN